MAVTAAELRVIVEASVANAIRDMQRVGTEADKMGGRQTAGARVSQAAGRAIVGASAAIGAGFAVAVQEGAEFQQGLADINTVARLSEGDTQRLGDALQQMSRDTGITTDELTAAMYDMVSAGTITADQLSNDLAGSMETVNAASMLAIGGMGTIGGTTDLLTSALNAYGLEASEATNVSDIFAVAIEKGKVTAEELGASLSNVAPIAAQAGISLEEISAGYATLTANGVPAAEASTQMRAAIVALISPNEKLKDIQDQVGINFADLAREQGLTTALEKLREVTGANNETLQELSAVTADEFPEALKAAQDELGLTNTEVEHFTAVAGKDGAAAAMGELSQAVGGGDAALADALGRVEGLNFTLQTTGENAADFGSNYEAAMDGAGTAAEQAAIRMEGPIETAKRLTANFMTFMQDVGGPFASTLGPVLMTVNNLGPAMALPIRGATALGGAFGWMAGKAVVMAGSLVSTVIPSIIALAAPFAVPLAIIAVVVAAVAGLFWAWTNNFLGIRDIAASVWDAITSYVETAWNNITGFVGAIVDIVSTIWNGVTAAAGAVWGAVTGFVSTAATNIHNFLAGLIQFVSGIWNGVVSAASTVWNGVYNVISGIVSSITGVIGGIVGVVSDVWNAVSGLFGFVSGETTKGVAEINGLKEASRTVSSGLGSYVPTGGGAASYAEGTMDTGRGGLAMLHPHEMVIPRGVAESIRASIRGGTTTDTGSGGRTGNVINVTITQPVKVKQPWEVAAPLRSLAALGIFGD